MPQHIRAFPNIDVFLYAHLAPKTDPVGNSGFAADPNLRGDQAIFAHDYPVTQVDLVIQFGPFAQDGIARNPFVDGTGRSNFDSVVDDDPTAT